MLTLDEGTGEESSAAHQLDQLQLADHQEPTTEADAAPEAATAATTADAEEVPEEVELPDEHKLAYLQTMINALTQLQASKARNNNYGFMADFVSFDARRPKVRAYGRG